MKKVILMAVAATMIGVGASAQNFNKGDWFVGAHTTSLGFGHSFGKNISSQTSIDLDATGGYFLSDKFAIDALAGFSYVRSGKKNTESHVSLADFAVGVGVRYYPVGNLFARIGYRGYATSHSNFISYLDAKVGYDIFLSKNVFFEPAIYYDKNLNGRIKRLGRTAGENIVGLSLGFGVKF